nr:hypothetical protein [Tanacetum cinerariifolium]
MAAFKVPETQFQMFIKSQIYLNDEYVIMTHKYFLEYTQLKIQELRDTLIQHIEYVKKSIDKRALHKREYDSTMNERRMRKIEKRLIRVKHWMLVWLKQKAVRQYQESMIQATYQEMMHMLMMQISDPYMMKSQWL